MATESNLIKRLFLAIDKTNGKEVTIYKAIKDGIIAEGISANAIPTLGTMTNLQDILNRIGVLIVSSFNSGSSTLTLDGVTTSYSFNHDLGSTPSSISITLQDTSDTNVAKRTITFDNTSITITFNVAPSEGSLIIYYQVFK